MHRAFTVAILAQGTHWAVANLQAFLSRDRVSIATLLWHVWSASFAPIVSLLEIAKVLDTCILEALKRN